MPDRPIREWIVKFNNGDFDAPDVGTQCDAGWYDWFCRDTSLAKKTQVLGNLVKQIAQSSKIDQDTMYVFFKNNCPMCGKKYDSFSFCDIETGGVIYWVTKCDGFDNTPNGKRAQVYGRENDFEKALVEGTWRDVTAWFGV